MKQIELALAVEQEPKWESTALVQIEGLKYRRPGPLLLCSIYGAKMKFAKNMTLLWGFVVDNEGVLRPKAI